MIYYVTKAQELFQDDDYKIISVEQSLELIKDYKIVQFDTETDGLDPYINKLLCIQIGLKENQLVIDCTSIDVKIYKEFLESVMLIGHNLCFDLQFLYTNNIIPTRVYDTMIVEQMLYLGFPKNVPITKEEYLKWEYDFPYHIKNEKYELSFALDAVAKKRLNVIIDKSVRGDIIWKGLSKDVIIYAAYDVVYLKDIMHSQVADCKALGALKGAKLECDCVPAMAYLEWCGIKLDEDKWKAKMQKDTENLEASIKSLNEYIINKPGSENVYIKVRKGLKNVKMPLYYIDTQGDLFTGYDLTPRVSINWASSEHVATVAKFLGFNTTIQDKKTGEDKDSVMEKHLSIQKGIDDEFLKLYFNYAGYAKVVSSFGQGHLNIIHPITGRVHTKYWQLGTTSGRMSCGSNQPAVEIAKTKKLLPSECKFPNLQQLPSDEVTRSAFVSEDGYKFVSADFSAEESRLGADIYNDTAMKDEFLYGSGDMHSLFAWMVFRKECEELGCKNVADIKKKAPQWRKKVKSVEFAWMFGAAAPTIAQSANCTVTEAQNYIDNLEKGFIGVSSFAKRGSAFVRKNGYILINPITGHRKWWWDHEKWLQRQESFTPEFWENYRENHKGTGDEIAKEVRVHFQAAAKYDRDARNVVTQGTGAIIMKQLMSDLFNWIVNNGYFNKIKIVASVHDEISAEYPEELSEFPKILTGIMENAAAMYCKSLPIPAEAAVDTCWVH